jgi:hypothetical protein
MDNLPALPPISDVIEEYPNWPVLFETLQGLDGAHLVRLGDTIGRSVIDAVNKADARVKAYAKRLPMSWASSLPGKMEQLGKDAAAIRIAEEKRIKDFREQVKRINAEVDKARTELARAEAERRAQVLREEEEAERKRHPTELESEPVMTPIVSEKQVAKEIFDTPGVTVKVIYTRKVAGWPDFLTWLSRNTNLNLISEQSDGSYRISFTSLKHSNMEIPGVKCYEDREFTNRMG